MKLCQWSKSDKILEVVRLLIGNGIAINQTDWFGRNSEYYLTANHRISQEKKGEILALLQHCAKDPNERPSVKDLFQHDKFQLDQQVC